MTEVIEINSLEELESYRLTWNALFPQTPRASFFHTFEWLRTYWQHFGNDQRLLVLIIRSRGTTIGIVPFCIRTERYHAGELRVLTYPLNNWGTWYGPIGPNPSACLFAAFQYLQNRLRQWDMIDLRWVPDADRQRSNVCNAMLLADMEPHVSTYQKVSLIEFEGLDWPAYLSQLSKKWRHEIRRQRRVLDRDFTVEFARHRPLGRSQGDEDPNWDLFEQCIEVSQKSWQSQSQTGNTLCHREVVEFLRDCHESAARLGMIDMAVLRLNDQPAAFLYNYCFEGHLYGLRTGFDQHFASYGTGKVLISHMIEDSFERGDKVIDLGVGDFDFKRQLRTGVETSYQFSCYPSYTFRPQVVRLSRWIKQRLPERFLQTAGK